MAKFYFLLLMLTSPNRSLIGCSSLHWLQQFQVLVKLHTERSDVHRSQGRDVRRGRLRSIVGMQQSEARRADGAKGKRREQVGQIHLQTEGYTETGAGAEPQRIALTYAL